VDLQVQPGLHLDERCQQAFYRVARESTQNIAKHAGATEVSISLSGAGGRAVLEVQDNGQGFDPAQQTQSGHVGLALMQDLASQVGGDLRVTSRPGEGTTVRFSMACAQ
jgi:signal transduction histidine kinase